MHFNDKIMRAIALLICVCTLVCALASCDMIFPAEGNPSTGGDLPSNEGTDPTDKPDTDPPADGGDGNDEENFSANGIFFSSSAPEGGDGSFENPYNSLESLSSADITPGTYIYIEKNSKFYGSLALTDIHGTEDEPVVVTTYGKGADPIIDGNDLEGSGVLYIKNCSNLIVCGLELTDSATDEGDRRGVLIVTDNNKGTDEVVTYSNIALRELYIHDIMGYRDADNSGMEMWSKITGGIHVWSTDGLGRVDGLEISDCEITEVSNVGIATWYKVVLKGDKSVSTKMVSPYSEEFADYAHLNVHIDRNEIGHIGKNAIFARNLLGGLIEHNVVHDTAKYCVSGNTIVTRSVDGTVIQYNEGYRNLARERDSDGKLQDGCMLDADLDSKYTVWQYNYSHDNSFGLFINCTESNDVAIVRYNLSVNDKGNKGVIYINYESAGIYIYNNTIVTSYDTEYIIQTNGTGRIAYFYNNLIYNRSDKAKFGISKNATITAENNLIFNEYGSSIESLDYFRSLNENGLYDVDPLFVGYLQEDSVPGINNQGAYMLDSNSPALGVGTEVAIVNDFFGNEYKKSIGFYCGK